MKDFNIVIAHRGPAMGLWATVLSCEEDLRHSKFDYSYLLCVNGDEKVSADTQNLIHFLQKTGRLGYVHHSPEPLSPPNARQAVLEHADGEILYFFDNHCLVARDYFTRSLLDFKLYGAEMDMLHSTTVFFSGDNRHYHYNLKLKKNFWANSATVPENELKPYRIAAGGHGGFAVRRSVWNEVGGYWNGFKGYGGEEMYFDLKMALLDKKNWLDPRMIHYHYAGQRGYPRHYTDDFFINMMMCANIIGGYDWMIDVMGSFAQHYPKHKSGRTFFDLAIEAEERSKEHAAHLASIRKRTLDEQLVLFRTELIAH